MSSQSIRRLVSAGLTLLAWACSWLAHAQEGQPTSSERAELQQQLIELRNQLEEVRNAPADEPAEDLEQEQRLDALEQQIETLEQEQRLDALERRIDTLTESVQQTESDLTGSQSGSGLDDDPQEELVGLSLPDEDYRGGALRLGVFQIDNISARLFFGPEALPLGARVDLEKDLGFKDRLTAFRAGFAYRFGERHGINVGYYNLELDGIRRLSRTIELGRQEFDIGIDVVSEYKEEVFKLAYNFIFYDEGRVALTVTPGIHFSSADFRIGTRSDLLIPQQTETASTTVPLPMFGGRLRFQITPKLAMYVVSDVFFLTSGDQEGSLTDSHVLLEHQTFDRIGFGGGINRWSLDLDLVDDGLRWDWKSVYTGAYLYMTVTF